MTALVLGTVVVAGCGGVLGSVVTTMDGLRSAGFSSVKVTPKVLSHGQDAVDVSVTVDAPPSLAASQTVARVVYRDLHERFDVLEVTVHGRGPELRRTLTFADLVSSFGARNPAYNRTSITSSAEDLVGVVAIGIVVVIVIVGAIAVVVVVRRRKRGPPAPWTGFSAAGPGWPPASPPQGGWASGPPRGGPSQPGQSQPGSAPLGGPPALGGPPSPPSPSPPPGPPPASPSPTPSVGPGDSTGEDGGAWGPPASPEG